MDDMDYGKDTMVRWEYTQAKLTWSEGTNPPHGHTTPLANLGKANGLGSEGWELAGIIEDFTVGLFKRPYRLCPLCDAKLVVGTETISSVHDERCKRYGTAT